MPETRECGNLLYRNSFNSLVKASVLSGASNFARASLKALQCQVLLTNWFGSFPPTKFLPSVIAVLARVS